MSLTFRGGGLRKGALRVHGTPVSGGGGGGDGTPPDPGLVPLIARAILTDGEASGGLPTGSYIMHGHFFADTHVIPTQHVELYLDDGTTAIPFQQYDLEATWDSSDLWFAPFLFELPAALAVSSGGTSTIQFRQVAGAKSQASSGRSPTIFTSGHDFKVLVTDSDTGLTWTAFLADGLTSTAWRVGAHRVLRDGPVAYELKARFKFKDGSGNPHPRWWMEMHARVMRDGTFVLMPIVRNGFLDTGVNHHIGAWSLQDGASVLTSESAGGKLLVYKSKTFLADAEGRPWASAAQATRRYGMKVDRYYWAKALGVRTYDPLLAVAPKLPTDATIGNGGGAFYGSNVKGGQMPVYDRWEPFNCGILKFLSDTSDNFTRWGLGPDPGWSPAYLFTGSELWKRVAVVFSLGFGNAPIYHAEGTTGEIQPIVPVNYAGLPNGDITVTSFGTGGTGTTFVRAPWSSNSNLVNCNGWHGTAPTGACDPTTIPAGQTSGASGLEPSHQPNCHKVAYMITGEEWHNSLNIENAHNHVFQLNPNLAPANGGAGRRMTLGGVTRYGIFTNQGQTRGFARGLVHIDDCVMMMPDVDVRKPYMRALLDTNQGFWKWMNDNGVYTTAQKTLGYIAIQQQTTLVNRQEPPHNTDWLLDMACMAKLRGRTSDIQFLIDTLGKWTWGRCTAGPGGALGFQKGLYHAATYRVQINDSSGAFITDWNNVQISATPSPALPTNGQYTWLIPRFDPTRPFQWASFADGGPDVSAWYQPWWSMGDPDKPTYSLTNAFKTSTVRYTDILWMGAALGKQIGITGASTVFDAITAARAGYAATYGFLPEYWTRPSYAVRPAGFTGA